MENGSSSEVLNKVDTKKGKNLSSMLPKLEPFIPRRDHNPRELMSWAKRTGFHSSFSGETGVSVSEKNDSDGFDLEKGMEKNGSMSPKIEIDPVLGRARNKRIEIEPVGHGFRKNEKDGGFGPRDGVVRGENQNNRAEIEPILRAGNEQRRVGSNGNGNRAKNGDGHGVLATSNLVTEPKKDDENVDRDVGIGMYRDGEEPGHEGGQQSSTMKCGMRDKPGFVPLICFGLQHYISLAGSLIFIPLIIVPAMGGTDVRMSSS